MKRQFAFSVATLLFACSLLTSCEKKEKAITLPPPTDAVPGNIVMGEAYETQVFYDFEKNTIAGTSAIASWDLAFEASPEGRHVFMNGGKGIFLYNTHQTAFGNVTSLSASVNSSTLLFDDPSGRGDSTAVRDWQDANGQSKHEVFIAKLNDATYYKFVLLSVDSAQYEFQYGSLSDATPKTFSLRKNELYNYSYFSFGTGASVMPDPPKANWDVVFTRYRYIYRDLSNLPYEINGCLINPYRVMAAADSTSGFNAITYASTTSLPYTTNRDAIGFDWKTYNFGTSRYEVNKNKCYVLHTRNGQVVKMHFLDFYGTDGKKGSPSFESQQIR